MYCFLPKATWTREIYSSSNSSRRKILIVGGEKGGLIAIAVIFIVELGRVTTEDIVIEFGGVITARVVAGISVVASAAVVVVSWGLWHYIWLYEGRCVFTDCVTDLTAETDLLSSPGKWWQRCMIVPHSQTWTRSRCHQAECLKCTQCTHLSINKKWTIDPAASFIPWKDWEPTLDRKSHKHECLGFHGYSKLNW